ncbi:hypothetical protein OROMI_017216 [Orobanche minor]
MASGSKIPIKKQYKSSKCPREFEFDSARFISSMAFKVFFEILSQENITDFYYFSFRSLERVGVEIRDFFNIGNLSQRADLHVGEKEAFTSFVLQSLVGVICVKILSEILNELFGLSNDGFVCSGKLSEDGETDLNKLDVNEIS